MSKRACLKILSNALNRIAKTRAVVLELVGLSSVREWLVEFSLLRSFTYCTHANFRALQRLVRDMQPHSLLQQAIDDMACSSPWQFKKLSRSVCLSFTLSLVGHSSLRLSSKQELDSHHADGQMQRNNWTVFAHRRGSRRLSCAISPGSIPS